MAWRWKARHSPRLKRSPLRTPLTRSPLRTPPRTPAPYSPLRTPSSSQTPPLLSTANYSPLKTPPLFSNISPRAPPMSHTPPLLYDSTWRTEPNFHYDLRWVSTLSPSSSPRRPNIMTPAGINPAIVPSTMREVDHFLSSTWNDAYDATSSSEYSRKLSELHRFYTSKMWEIEDKEKKALAESLSAGDQPGPSGLNTLGDCLMDAEIKQRYTELKRHVKEETVQAILKLNAKFPSPHKQRSNSPQQHRTPHRQTIHTPSPSRRSRQVNISPQQCRGPYRSGILSSPKQGTKATRGEKSPKRKSPQKPSSRIVWDSWKLDILNIWFDEHSDKPYPSKKEKEELAKHCKMNVKQVSTWFNNKRYRSNCTLTKKGKGRGKGSK